MRIPVYKKMNDYVTENQLSRKAIAINMKISESRLSLMLNGKRRVTAEDYFDFCAAVAVSPIRFMPEEN
jgi:plasmid maintenance system antidote protein VapI